MKILYTEGKFYSGGSQIIFCPINAENLSTEYYQKTIDSVFPLPSETKNKMYVPVENVDPPFLGDVIWLQTSGSKWLSFAIIQETPSDGIHEEALRLCLRSIVKKADELGQSSISMPLFVTNGDLGSWNDIYPIVEEELERLQVVVYIPDNKTLVAVLGSLPGDEFKEIAQGKVHRL